MAVALRLLLPGLFVDSSQVGVLLTLPEEVNYVRWTKCCIAFTTLDYGKHKVSLALVLHKEEFVDFLF